MRRYQFTVPGEPKGKARARSFAKVLKSGKAISGNYTPDKTRNNEAFIKDRFLSAFPDYKPFDGMVKLEVMAYFAIPKSTSRAKREAMLTGQIQPMKKPDAKNILASVEDALNEIAYKDDSQIVDTRCEKFYAEVPLVAVMVTLIEPFV